MISFSGVISIIIQKNMLCTNKIRVIYFCPNCVNVLAKSVHVLFLGRQLPPCPTPPLSQLVRLWSLDHQEEDLALKSPVTNVK